MYENHILLRALRAPRSSVSFTLKDWELCIRLARRARVLARLCCLLQEQGLLQSLPQQAREHLDAAQAGAAQQERVLRWEANRLERILSPLNTPMVLLKGSAYLLSGLPPARGRLYSDVDILVPKSKLGLVESTLLESGWEALRLDGYDQRYYRTWMHELPPLRHRERETVIDIHHAILPETGRLHPDSALLLESAMDLRGSIFKVLAPADMVLHSAAHMFQDGELAGSLRDLTDLDDLLRFFGKQKNFWDGLVPRAIHLDLTRPLFYALRYAHQLFDTPIPAPVHGEAKAAGRPPAPILRLMDYLVHRALVLASPDITPISADLSRWLLYIRSHWLRMPPLLLARHLLKKSLPRRDSTVPQ
jgi:hypothetical protein